MREFFIALVFLFFLLAIPAHSSSVNPSIAFDSDENIITFSFSGIQLANINDISPYLVIKEKNKEPVEIRSVMVVGDRSKGKLVLETTGDLGLEIRQTFQLDRIEGMPVIISDTTLSSNRDSSYIIQQSYALISEECPILLSPGYIYNTNNATLSEGLSPQVVYGGRAATPESSVFNFRADRSSHSSILANLTKGVFGICLNEGKVIGDKFFYNGLGLDVSNNENNTVSVFFGYENYPARYNGNCNPRISGRWSGEPEFGWFDLKKGKTCHFQHIIYLGKLKESFVFAEPLRLFYYYLRPEISPSSRDPKHIAELICEAILKDSVVEECGLFRVIDKKDECDIGWTGGIMVAYPLLLAGLKWEIEPAREVSIEAIDSLVNNGFNEHSGFFYDAWIDGKWTVDGWWKIWAGGNHLAYTNGQSIYYILSSYSVLPQDIKSQKQNWIDRCSGILDKALQSQKSTGEFPASFNPEDGSPGNIVGFGGCWFLPALLKAYETTGDKKYLYAVQKAEPFYFDWLKTLEVWGTPIDAEGAVECEGNLPLVMAEHLLHKYTGDPFYLDHLKFAVQYDLTWKWAYNTYLENPPLSELNWKSLGGNSASTCNIHLHPMSSMILGDLLYLYKVTGDDYYYHRYEDAVNFGLQCINTEKIEYGFGKAGWGTEQFFHTDALQGQGPPDGGIWTRYLPWATAVVLKGIVSDSPENLR